MVEASVFELLDKKIGNLAKGRFGHPTPIQQQVIPKIMEGKDVLVISETGSGKTESCLLPIFNTLVSGEDKPISVLYITPLKSLNRDLQKRILWWSEHVGFEVGVRHGDTSQYERGMQAANPPNMMISTPETLQAIITGSRMREHLKNIKSIVIDEVHELVGSKRGVQLAGGLARLFNLIKERGGKVPQLIGLSATVGSPQEVASFIGGEKQLEIMNSISMKEIAIEVEHPSIEKKDKEASAYLFTSPQLTSRLRVIRNYIKEKDSVLVFTNTREQAEMLSSRIKVMDSGLSLETHHSSLSKDMRIQAEEEFKDGKLTAIVCTSSLELGIDVGSIDFIIQYTSPRQVSKLVQRTGRSGHSLNKVSRGVIITNDAEDCFESSVIARQALNGEIEPTRIYSRAWDVLAHQIIGLALEEYNIPVSKVYNILKTAAPFNWMSKDDFLQMCEFVQRLGFIWLNSDDGEPVIRRRRKAWTHYYQNLSTIPDVRNFRIIDIATNKSVGTLDAEFVAMHGTPGTTFICRGRAWKILDVTDRITAEPVSGVEGAIPAWEGELLAVPYEVGQEVGELRRELKGKPREEGLGYLMGHYPVSKETAEIIEGKLKEQESWGFVPTDKDILVEYGRMSGSGTRMDYRESYDYVIFHTCFGSRVNDTLGRALSILLMNRLGSVGLQSDPYRIILKFPAGTGDAEMCTKAFRGLDIKLVKTLLDTALPNTDLFQWRFLHCAKRFGIIARDADFGKGYLRKIMEVYNNTPVHFEALNEVWQEKLDMVGAKKVLERLARGELTTTIKEGLSPIGRNGLMSRYEIIASSKPEKEVLEAIRERLLNTKVRLVCCNCAWGITYKVKDIPSEIRCLKCRAKLIGVIKWPYEEEKERLLAKFLVKRDLTPKEISMVNGVMNTSGLVLSSGKDAIMALAGRGIGPKTASRILAKVSDKDSLIRAILEAERNFAKTKRFWSD